MFNDIELISYDSQTSFIACRIGVEWIGFIANKKRNTMNFELKAQCARSTNLIEQ